MLKSAVFIKYGDNPAEDDIIEVRKLTPKEKERLLELLLERMNDDTLADTLAEVAQEATRGQADSIIWS